MIHHMKLNDVPFKRVEGRAKTVELRLFDEKRRMISIGDTVVFSHAEHPERTLQTRVTSLHRYGSFGELYAALPHDKLGYLEEESASPSDMDAYYSAEEQKLLGVIGIEIELM